MANLGLVSPMSSAQLRCTIRRAILAIVPAIVPCMETFGRVGIDITPKYLLRAWTRSVHDVSF